MAGFSSKEEIQQAAERFIAEQAAKGRFYIYDEASIERLEDDIAAEWSSPVPEPSESMIASYGAFYGQAVATIIGGKWGKSKGLWVVAIDQGNKNYVWFNPFEVVDLRLRKGPGFGLVVHFSTFKKLLDLNEVKTDEPMSERHFLRLRIESFAPEGVFGDKMHKVMALGYGTPNPGPEDQPTQFATAVEVGQTVQQAIAESMQSMFGVSEFKIFEVTQDGYGNNKKGEQVPRFLVRLGVGYDALPQTALGRHVRWASIGEVATQEEVGYTPESLREWAEGMVKFMAEFPTGAVQVGFDEPSLNKVDEFIEERWGREGLPEGSQGDVIINGFAAYYGEVLVRQLGGQWREDQGEWIVVLPGTHGDAVAYPFASARKRFRNGMDDSLAYKFVVMRKMVAEGPPKSQRGS